MCDGRVDEMTDDDVVGELRVLERTRRTIDARIATLTATLSRRRARSAAEQAPDDRGVREAERAARDARRELADQLGWSPQDTRRNERDGRNLDGLPRFAEAARRGEITPRHVRAAAQTLDHLTGELRERVEAELVEAARIEDPVTFGRTCRRRLGELDAEASTREHRKRAARTKASLVEEEGGMVRLFGQWTGLEAETIATAIHAFRRPDAPGELRRADQATAEALVEVARAALRAGESPHQHGVRPHVILTVPISLLEAEAGIAEGTWTGPVDRDALRAVLDDVGLSWLVTDEDGLPMEAGAEKRTVPVGLWRALQIRDGGCIHRACDAPAVWCDVMHLDAAFAQGGRLSLDNAALGCRRHHRAYDAGRLELHWNDRRPELRSAGSRPPDRESPERGPSDRKMSERGPSDREMSERQEPDSHTGIEQGAFAGLDPGG